MSGADAPSPPGGFAGMNRRARPESSESPESPRSSGHATVRDLAAMRRALELAKLAGSLGEVPVGAVVYRDIDGATLGEGFNRREIDSDPLAHAEMLALRAASLAIGDWRLSGCTLVVTLEPCCMCAGGAVNARVDRLVFGATDPKAGACESLFTITSDARLNHRIATLGGVLAEESSALLREFFQRLRSGAKGA